MSTRRHKITKNNYGETYQETSNKCKSTTKRNETTPETHKRHHRDANRPQIDAEHLQRAHNNYGDTK